MGCTNSVPQTSSTIDELTTYSNYDQFSYETGANRTYASAPVPSDHYSVGTQVTYHHSVATSPPVPAPAPAPAPAPKSTVRYRFNTYHEVKAELLKSGLCKKLHFNDIAYRIILEVFPSIYACVEFEYQKKDIKLWTIDKEIYFEMYHLSGTKTKLRRRDYSVPTAIYHDWPVKVWSEVKLNDFPDYEDPFRLILCCYRIIKRDPIVNLGYCLSRIGWTQVRDFNQCQYGNTSEMYAPLRDCLFDNKSKTVYVNTGIQGAYFSIDWDDPNDSEDITDSDDEDDEFKTNININVVVTAEAGARINT